jgi:hypothetical protein
MWETWGGAQRGVQQKRWMCRPGEPHSAAHGSSGGGGAGGHFRRGPSNEEGEAMREKEVGMDRRAQGTDK